MRLTASIAAAAFSAFAATACFADITGKVSIKGNVPQMKPIAAMKAVPACAAMHKEIPLEQTVVTDGKGGLTNVAVYLRDPGGQPIAGPQITTPAVLDQKGCMYDPHVLAVEVNQPIEAKNSDALLHNVHTMPFSNNAENFAMVMVGVHKMGPFNQAENFMVKCDVHPWMQAFIVVVDNPFFAVSGKDGTYTIKTKGLKDGTYDLVFWQEKYGEKTQKVTVKDGKATGDYTFDADAKSQAAVPTTTVKLASLVAPDSAACCEVDKAPAKTAVAASK